MARETKKQILIIGVVILIVATPFFLLSSYVLTKFQARNDQLHEKLVKKNKNDKNVEEWKNLKFRQKLIGDLYYYTFREPLAIDAYEKYMSWFREDFWNSREFVLIKYHTGLMYREFARVNATGRAENFRKAGCHLLEIKMWYDQSGKFRETWLKSRNALIQFDLKQRARNCRDHPVSRW